MFIILFFIIILVINLLYNYWYYRQCEKHINRFGKWLFDSDFEEDLSSDRPQVIKLIKNAGLYDLTIPVVRPMGLGYVANGYIKPVDQYPDRMSDVAGAIKNQLESAKGVYKQRMIFSINPFMWLELVIYLPSHILKYLGFNNVTIGKLLNVIWWIFGVIIIPILITVYSEELTHFFKDYLKLK